MTEKTCGCLNEKVIVDGAIEPKIQTLRQIEGPDDSWNRRFECPQCGCLWELSYPGAGSQCCEVDPVLGRISGEKRGG